MKTYFVFGDPHNEFSILKTALLKAGFDDNNETHILIGLGDYFDRGEETIDMYNYLFLMHQKNRAILIKGNHDEFIEELWLGKDQSFNMYNNGFLITANQFAGTNYSARAARMLQDEMSTKIKTNYPQLFDFIRNMRLQFQLGFYNFSHGGYSLNYNTNIWFVDNWCNTPIFIDQYPNTEKLIYVFGHWHAHELCQDFGIVAEIGDYFQYKAFIGLDSVVNYTKKMNILVLECEDNNTIISETIFG